MHSWNNNPALAYSFHATSYITSCPQSLVSDILATVFGKKRRLNAEINAFFTLIPKTTGAARSKDNQEFHNREKISILTLCLWRFRAGIKEKKRKKYPIFKKTQKKVDIR
jgi:hypothetical protein